MRGIIEYTIKYLFNDRLFGFFLNSIILNNRLIKICRELDALGFDSNVFSNFNLSRRKSFCEKDSVLLEKRSRGKMRKKQVGKSREDLCRDFMIEIILGSMIASVVSNHSRQGSICKRAATYDSPSNEKIDRTVSIESSLQTRKNSQNIFVSCRLKNSSNLLKPFEENEYNGIWSAESCRDSKEASLGVASLPKCCSTLNRRRCCRRCRRRCCRRCRRRCRHPRIVSLKSNIRRRRSRLSLPFKVDLREIFSVDPIFHESCLLNFSFCLNTVNRKISNKNNILELCLILDIRKDYVNFKLTIKRSHETRPFVFFNNRRVRVTICQRKQMRERKNLLEERRKQLLIENIDRISDNLSSRCLSCRAEKISLEEILFDRTTEECSCLSSSETPYVQSPRINEDLSIFEENNCSSFNIFKNNDNILNSTKEVRKEQMSQLSKIIEDVCSQSYCNLETGENEEIVNNMDSSSTTRKIFSKEEVNFDCDSKCSCCSKASSLFSVERQNDEDAASNVILINEEKLEEAQKASIIASAMMGVSLLDISKKKDYQVPSSPTSGKNNYTNCDVSLSNSSANSIVPTVNIGVQIFPNDESSRKMKIEIFSKEDSRRLILPIDREKRFQDGKYKKLCSSVCTCDTWTRSYNRMQPNNVGLRDSSSILQNFCESFYLSGIRSIRRLKKVVRLNLRRFMRKGHNQRETIDKRLFDEKNFIYEKREYKEEKKGVGVEVGVGRGRERGRANDLNGLTYRDNYFPYDSCNQCSKECKNNYLPISARGSIRRSKSRSRCLFEMKNNYGEYPRRKSKEVKRAMVDLSSIRRNEEKSMNDLSLDFRSKLEQYVALCKNIKYCLMGNGKRGDLSRRDSREGS